MKCIGIVLQNPVDKESRRSYVFEDVEGKNIEECTREVLRLFNKEACSGFETLEEEIHNSSEEFYLKEWYDWGYDKNWTCEENGIYLIHTEQYKEAPVMIQVNDILRKILDEMEAKINKVKEDEETAKRKAEYEKLKEEFEEA